MREKARQAWGKFNQRIAALSLAHQPPSPLATKPNTLNFIHGEKPAVCEDKQVLEDLEQALKVGNYQATIFEHPELSQAALKLFCDDAINREQMSSILEIQEAKELAERTLLSAPEAKESIPAKVCIHPIFESEESNQFSKAAKWFLLPFLRYHSKHLNNLSEEQLRFFKALMKEVPLSERYFFTISQPNKSDKHYKENELRNVLVRFDSLLLHESSSRDHLIGLTFSAKNARLIARCGIDNMVAHVANLGRKSVDEMLMAAQHDVRYADVYFPKVPTYEQIHNYPAEQFSEYYNTNHDYDHANTASLTPRHFRHALLRMALISDALCKRHKYRGCTARWDLIDQEFTYFRYIRAFHEGAHYNEAVFCDHLDHGTGGPARRTNGAHLFTPNRLTPLYHVHEIYNDLGIFVMVDMCAHPEEWEALGINPENLTGDYLTLYQRVKRIYPFIERDADYLQVFKLQQTYNLKTDQQCRGMCRLISILAPQAGLKRNMKKATLGFEFSRRFDHLYSQDFLALLKNEYAPKLADLRYRTLFLETIDCLSAAESLYLSQKVSQAQGYFSFFRGLFPQQGSKNLRYQILELIEGFSVIKDEDYKAVLMLAIGRCELWRDSPRIEPTQETQKTVARAQALGF